MVNEYRWLIRRNGPPVLQGRSTPAFEWQNVPEVQEEEAPDPNERDRAVGRAAVDAFYGVSKGMMLPEAGNYVRAGRAAREAIEAEPKKVITLIAKDAQGRYAMMSATITQYWKPVNDYDVGFSVAEEITAAEIEVRCPGQTTRTSIPPSTRG